MSKVNNRNTRAYLEQIDFEHISHHILVFLLLTLSRQIPAGDSNNFDETLVRKDCKKVKSNISK